MLLFLQALRTRLKCRLCAAGISLLNKHLCQNAIYFCKNFCARACQVCHSPSHFPSVEGRPEKSVCFLSASRASHHQYSKSEKMAEGPSTCTWVPNTKAKSPHTVRPMYVPSFRFSRIDHPTFLIWGFLILLCSPSRPKIMNTILENIGNTPMVRINKITKAEGIQCEIRTSSLSFCRVYFFDLGIVSK
jgi:hypothetical protein